MDVVIVIIPHLTELLRDAVWDVRQAAASSLAEFAKNGE
jgi:HEAT repeat protein